MILHPRLLLFLFVLSSLRVQASTPDGFRIIGYYAGPTEGVDSMAVEQLTHLIFCFGGLQGDAFSIRSKADSQTIHRMVALKKHHPKLKVMLSLGGWGGCATCSEVFSDSAARKNFAQSVRTLTSYLHTDGIDLDWEYPVVSGFPGHRRHPSDQANFTALLQAIREVNPPPFEISFAAGGYTAYFDSAINWTAIQAHTNFINIMSYDLVHGHSKISGHHTPLYSTPQQTESTDHAVNLLIQKGVPPSMLVIGAAFYGRYFAIDSGRPVQLYEPCHFDHAFSYRHAVDSLSTASGFQKYWDTVAQAPYAIHPARRLLATYDDERSVALKTQYALDQGLGGIMFWQLVDDKPRHGLLHTMFSTVQKNKK